MIWSFTRFSLYILWRKGQLIITEPNSRDSDHWKSENSLSHGSEHGCGYLAPDSGVTSEYVHVRSIAHFIRITGGLLKGRPPSSHGNLKQPLQRSQAGLRNPYFSWASPLIHRHTASWESPSYDLKQFTFVATPAYIHHQSCGWGEKHNPQLWKALSLREKRTQKR